MAVINSVGDKIKYSELLSSLFCSVSIFTLSILSLINNLSLDLYSMFFLLKTVFPAAVCFWFLGHVIGTILDKYNTTTAKKKNADDAKAYEIPSIFSDANMSAAEGELGENL